MALQGLPRLQGHPYLELGCNLGVNVCKVTPSVARNHFKARISPDRSNKARGGKNNALITPHRALSWVYFQDVHILGSNEAEGRQE
jgi:hypothetical protein